MKCGLYIFKHLYYHIIFKTNKKQNRKFKKQGIVLLSDLFGRRLKSSFPFTLFESLMMRVVLFNIYSNLWSGGDHMYWYHMCILGDKIIFSLRYLQMWKMLQKICCNYFFQNYFKDKICEVEGTICLTHFYIVVTSSLSRM
jgi:hypothetical protein